MLLSKQALAIIKAKEQGYTYCPSTGTLRSRSGAEIVPKASPCETYPRVTIYVRGEGSFSVKAHRLAAYFLFGIKTFEKGIHVRHGSFGVLDISEKNLSLGTQSENELDKCPEHRSNHAKKMRAIQLAAKEAV